MAVENKNNNGVTNNGRIEGVSSTIGLQQIGSVFSDTTQSLSAKIVEEISTTFGLTELDNIIITPKIAKNGVGASEFVVTAYFSTNNPNGNIYYRGNKNKNRQGRFVSVLDVVGSSNSGIGPFGTSETFNAVIKPLCKVGDNGSPIMNIKTVPGSNSLAQLELDFNAVMCIALCIKPNDPYDFSIMSVTPIQKDANSNFASNFSIGICKFITNTSSRKGRSSQFNYNRVEQEQFNRLNNNNNNGRRYN